MLIGDEENGPYNFNKKAKILDCAAGTGIYSFELAHEGHEVTALDLTPRHVSIMKDRIVYDTKWIKGTRSSCIRWNIPFY
ncbi:class I SAM-dependent methyltransferase [Vallitalea guaymasensis]|uniref:Class I SAM-dependent methyltransferase n=1 Tax=Vallitalea guaymasensis TaxID=1185412 RepID=A0A8J8SBL6_9FIRM|nr:class I SAM-dependent methyltransferase [Vallitalea guaymasensis]QUH28540.1 class I SAM-dependent methyltransferase [Vallitalea guaymasensis]